MCVYPDLTLCLYTVLHPSERSSLTTCVNSFAMTQAVMSIPEEMCVSSFQGVCAWSGCTPGRVSDPWTGASGVLLLPPPPLARVVDGENDQTYRQGRERWLLSKTS